MGRRKKLILNALFLTFTTLILGFVGMAFRVYISNKIGPEGMGLFQLIMSVNIMAITLSTAGIRIAITRLVAEEIGKGNHEKVKDVVKKGFIYSLIFSISSTLVLYHGAEFISLNILKDERAIIPLKILAYGLPFMGISSCLNGYFYGVRKVVKSVSADVLEQTIMMAIIVFTASTFTSRGMEYVCAITAVSMSVSQIIGTCYAYTLYIFEKKPYTRSAIRVKEVKCKLSEVMRIALPIGSSSYIQTGLRTIEDILIPDALRKANLSGAGALAAFGMIKGMVLPILAFPAMFLASFSTLIIPEISEANASSRKNMVNYIISKVLKFTLLIALFATGVFMAFSNELGLAIYNRQEVGIMMRILAPLIPLMYLDRIVDGSLNAINEQMSTLRFNIIDMLVRIAVIYYLIPKRGLEGFIMVIFISTILNSSLSINRLLKVTKIEFKIFDWLIRPIICIALATCVVNLGFEFLGGSLNCIQLLVTYKVVISMVIYFILLILTGTIRKRDIMWFVESFKSDKEIALDKIGLYKDMYQ